MSTVQRIDGSIVEGVIITNDQHVGEEGSKRGIAHINNEELPVYNSIIDGFDPIWYEQDNPIWWQDYKFEKYGTPHAAYDKEPVKPKHKRIRSW